MNFKKVVGSLFLVQLLFIY